MEIKGAATFKAIAFSRVSRILKDLTFDAAEAVKAGTLKQIDGIGASSQKIIQEYVATGRSSDCDELIASVPAGLLSLLEIPGLGPKTISLLWKQRNVTGLDDLVKLLDSGAWVGIKGLGEKKIQVIRDGIALRARSVGRVGIAEAMPIALTMLEAVRGMKQVHRTEIAGSLRRCRETVGDLDIVCALNPAPGGVMAVAGAAVAEAFCALPQVERILGQGSTKASVLTDGGLQVDLRIVPNDSFGAALMYFTGSKDHNVKVRGLAQAKGKTLNEWGLYDAAVYRAAGKSSGEAPAINAEAGADEAGVYKALGLEYIEPELREDRGEMDAAAAGKLPRLITIQDIRGDLHTHTTASDGVASIEEMAEAAKARGYVYLAITDHSRSQAIARGLEPDRLLAHIQAIRAVSERIDGITLLAGSEVDILADGRLDYEDEILKQLDIVIASPHMALRQDQPKATARMLRAIDHRYVNVIGHPTGRLINARDGLPLDFAKVFAAAASAGVALEINSGYPRLDLNDVNARGTIEAGAMLSINTDAHSTCRLEEMHWGLGVARRAWVEAKHVINCLKPEDLRRFLGKKR